MLRPQPLTRTARDAIEALQERRVIAGNHLGHFCHGIPLWLCCHSPPSLSPLSWSAESPGGKREGTEEEAPGEEAGGGGRKGLQHGCEPVTNFGGFHLALQKHHWAQIEALSYELHPCPPHYCKETSPCADPKTVSGNNHIRRYCKHIGSLLCLGGGPSSPLNPKQKGT